MKMTTIAIAAGISALATLRGQGPGGRGNGAPPVEVGSALADVTAIDERGEAFPLREKLKGRPAVIVFGCLT